jgi:hypothetical protein
MVALNNRAIEFAETADALVRVFVVTDYITKTDEVGAFVVAGIGQDRLEGFEVGMNVTDNRETHGWPER